MRTARRLVVTLLIVGATALPVSASTRPELVPAPADAAVATVVTVSGCPGAETPPAPPADEELVAALTPLPWPAEPVGGPRLADCGEILPPGVAAPGAVGAAAWVLADLDTGAVLAARAPHARHRPASTLKVLTALVALDRLDPDMVVEATMEDANIEGSRAGIGPGGSYTVRQLLAGLLLNSGNDTANALARSLGGPAATTAAMDDEARRFGALDTRAATPSGLDGPGMASSAYDLAVLFRIAMRKPLFAETTATRSVPFPGHGEQPGFVLTNSDKLLTRYRGTVGGKTGFTDAARHTFVGAASRDGRRLVVALVRGEQRPVPMWEQAAKLLDMGFAMPRETPAVGTLVDAAPPQPRGPVPGAPFAGVGGGPPDPVGPRDPVGPVALVVGAGVGLGGIALFRSARRN